MILEEDVEWAENRKSFMYSLAKKDYGLSLENAEDVFQNIFLNIIRKGEEFYEGIQNFPLYFFGSFKHGCIDFSKKDGSIKRRIGNIIYVNNDNEGYLKLFSNRRSLIEMLVLDQVREVVDNLNERDREVIIMSYEGGMSTREIAKEINSTEGAVDIRLYRARNRLREYLLESNVNEYIRDLKSGGLRKVA